MLKLWLEGSKKGTTETFVGQLPGAPDGLSRSSHWYDNNRDTYWVCLVAKASPLAYLAPYPKLRKIAAHLILPLLPKIASKILGSTAALKVDVNGKVVRAYVDSESSTLQTISGVTETQEGDAVFFGSLSGNYVSKMALKD